MLSSPHRRPHHANSGSITDDLGSSSFLHMNGGTPKVPRMGMKLSLEDDDLLASSPAQGSLAGLAAYKFGSSPPNSSSGATFHRQQHSSSFTSREATTLPSTTPRSSADIPLVGSGSRSKILSQLGEPIAASTGNHKQAWRAEANLNGTAHHGIISATHSSASLRSDGSVSPPSGIGQQSSQQAQQRQQQQQSSPRSTSRERPALGFRKVSGSKLSSPGLPGGSALISNSSPAATPTRLSGVLPPHSGAYFGSLDRAASPSAVASLTAATSGYAKVASPPLTVSPLSTPGRVSTVSPRPVRKQSIPSDLSAQHDSKPAVAISRQLPSVRSSSSNTNLTSIAASPPTSPAARKRTSMETIGKPTSREGSGSSESSGGSYGLTINGPSSHNGVHGHHRPHTQIYPLHSFKMALPPVEQSPRQTLSSPKLSTSASSPNMSSPVITTASAASAIGKNNALLPPNPSVTSLGKRPSMRYDEIIPNGMVAPGRQSFSELDRNMHVDKAAARWPSMANGRSTDPDLADDGQLEEIVPWLYQGKDGRSNAPGSPISPRTVRQDPMQTRSSVSGIRISKSTNNLKPRTDSGGSIDTLPEIRDRKQSGRFIGMLRKKSSAIAGNIHEVLSPNNRSSYDTSPRGSVTAGSASKGMARPKMSPRAATSAPDDSSKLGKRFKKQKGRGDSVPLPSASVGGTGFALDTNLDEMEGIVNLENLTQPFAAGYTMAATYEHLNQATLLANNSPRPGTPPSPSQSLNVRRPSLAASVQDFMAADAPEFSPLSKRLGLSRRDSMDIVASMNRWSANGGLGAAAAAPSSIVPSSNNAETVRKSSVTSLLNDRRGSEGTANPALPDAGWTAPDSWAVKQIHTAAKEDDFESDEDVAVATGRITPNKESIPPTPSFDGDTPGIELSGYTFGTANHNRLPLKLVGGRTRDPSLAGLGLLKGTTGPQQSNIRIFKPDNAHTILSVPYNTSTAELMSMVSKKPGFISSNSKLPLQSYRLYCRARGLERMMHSAEKPLLWQDRKFRQAGYDPETDRLEDLGREDNSYLVRFIVKPEPMHSLRAEEEGLEGFEYIDLAGRQIVNLPIFLYKHAHEIISLNLSRNARLHLPSDFVQACTSLRDLKMVEMGMKRIPQSVRQITALTRLDLSINRIVDLEHAMLNDLPELTSLFVHNNRLTSLPDYFIHFQSLKYLNISNNRFETFPVVVCEVITLNDLDISVNNLTSIPSEIGKLRNLERLLACNNLITALPSALSALTKLRELDVRYNQVADFTPINDIPNLVTVRAQFNAAKFLDLRLGSLSVLNLSFSALTRFAVTGSDRAAALTHLDLSHARLETVPEDLFMLCTSLHSLTLSDNKIRVVSEHLERLTKLNRLLLNNNAILQLPESIGKLQHLTFLDASNNKLTVLPASIWLCSELSVLILSSNNLHEIPDPPTAIDAADSESEQTAFTRSDVRAAPPIAYSLQRLFLANNRLRDDVFRPVSLLTSLTLLNLSANDIYEIPPGLLSKCYQLTHMYLSGNMLTSLPADDLQTLGHLRLLHLNGNKLQTLPAELARLTALQVLDVGSNALKYNIANWPYDWNWNWNLELRYLNLSGNKRLEIKPSAASAHEISPAGGLLKKRNLSDFSALSKMRVLGLMDVTLMIPSVPDEGEDRRVRTSLSSINEMGYGVADSLGTSEHLAMIDLVVPKFRGKDDECVIGIFDAGHSGERHSGAKIAKFVTDHFVQRLTLELSRLRDEDASQGLRRCFLSLQRDWGNMIMPAYDRGRKESDVMSVPVTATSGDIRATASAAVLYVYKKTLYVANVGNAMAVIAGRTMLARMLTTKHEPWLREEVVRIRSSEGWISTRGLVNDQVEHSRSFGCFHVFPAVNADPAVHVLDLLDDDEFVIVANGGLWKAMSYQAAVDIAWENREDPMLAAQKLRDMAIAYGCESNILVMVISVGDLFKGKQVLHKGLNGSSAGNYDNKYAGRRQVIAPGLRAADTTIAPQGTVALVFTDIRNSTALWETNPGMQNAMRIHHDLLRRLIRAFDGYEVKTEGDAFMVSFSSITSAALWCFTVQLELLRADWPAELLSSDEGKEIYGPYGEVVYRGLSVRMGLHWGTPICEQDPVNHRMDYLGPVVNRAARVSGVAEGGQITASADAVELLRALLSATSDNEDEASQPLVDPNDLDAATKRDIAALRQTGFGVSELGEKRLKGLETPEFLSLIYPNALSGRLAGAKTSEAAAIQSIDGVVSSPEGLLDDAVTSHQPLLDVQNMRSLCNISLRLEALSAGQGHKFYDVSTQAQSTQNSPAIGFTISSATPRRRITLSPHLSLAMHVRSDASEEQLLVLLELLVVRVENVLAALQIRQLGPFTDVLAAMGDAVRIDPQYILHALSVLSQML